MTSIALASPRSIRRRVSSSDRILVLALSALGLVALAVVVGPLVWRFNSNAVDLGAQLSPPSSRHPLGTDSLGRDLLARVLAGARTSLGAGLLVALAGAVLGCLTGLLAGALRGYVDVALTWLTNSILCFPSIMLAMAVVMALKPGIPAVVIGLSIHSFPWYMRTLRGEVMRVSAMEFVKSTRAIGASQRRVLFRHILPHLISTIVLQMAAVFGAAVLALAALGFLGMGAQPPTAELGAMITDGQQFFLTGQWWVAAFPGLVLLVAVTLTTIIADRAREILDPRGEYIVAD
ncbi:peptide/nickel transport system permease protein [Kribbella aluminosa]|uniref:Peptide/nickel transport system permease protein n=1 Tax=Kribbella aluminosa TaxID=416017 RepID=A0ABS4UJN7_9ACTN|nr:ABC transporter permease [Kribbella aluminosa]MBP2351829.1 peptide/nickel transport system permease protein [Kribbella aluminosa]